MVGAASTVLSAVEQCTDECCACAHEMLLTVVMMTLHFIRALDAISAQKCVLLAEAFDNLEREPTKPSAR